MRIIEFFPSLFVGMKEFQVEGFVLRGETVPTQVSFTKYEYVDDIPIAKTTTLELKDIDFFCKCHDDQGYHVGVKVSGKFFRLHHYYDYDSPEECEQVCRPLNHALYGYWPDQEIKFVESPPKEQSVASTWKVKLDANKRWWFASDMCEHPCQYVPDKRNNSLDFGWSPHNIELKKKGDVIKVAMFVGMGIGENPGGTFMVFEERPMGHWTKDL